MAFAKLISEIWFKDLAYVDNVAKKGIKFLLVRQDLFNRTVNAKGMKTKDFQETVKAVSSLIKKIDRKRFGLIKGPNLMERLEMFVLQRGYKFTLQSVRLRRLLLNVQYDH